eukprot:TRINITY_DN14557_c0_g1_i1.p2 TRINITY_DN14557_c0_g1~~TRINITY_DN14557_c0_g1_i1.p2  ORF type:complete len:137 (-),score=57.24 TRINITY_DN14557_c0_g1_i1:64-474(-)
MSAIHPTDECVNLFNEIKIGHKHKYAFFKFDNIADPKNIVVEKVGDTGTYAEFTKLLPADDCRYAVYDFDFTSEDGRKMNKLLFINWAPDSAKIKPKMLFAASKDNLKKKLTGVVEIQATDASEVDLEAVMERVRK